MSSFMKEGIDNFMLMLRKEDTLQLVKFEFQDLDIITAYRYDIYNEFYIFSIINFSDQVLTVC